MNSQPANQPAAPGAMQAHCLTKLGKVHNLSITGFEAIGKAEDFMSIAYVLPDRADDVLEAVNHHAALVAEVENLRKALKALDKRFEPFTDLHGPFPDQLRARELLEERTP